MNPGAGSATEAGTTTRSSMLPGMRVVRAFLHGQVAVALGANDHVPVVRREAEAEQLNFRLVLPLDQASLEPVEGYLYGAVRTFMENGKRTMYLSEGAVSVPWRVTRPLRRKSESEVPPVGSSGAMDMPSTHLDPEVAKPDRLAAPMRTAVT